MFIDLVVRACEAVRINIRNKDKGAVRLSGLDFGETALLPGVGNPFAVSVAPSPVARSIKSTGTMP